MPYTDLHWKDRKQLFHAWRNMKARCANENLPLFKNHGGRGISFCTKWDSFEPFLSWALTNGFKRGLSLDRKNNDGNYTPENCRWATRKEQNTNQRSNHHVSFKGKTQSILQWAKEYDLKYGTLYHRLFNLRWPIEQALTTPLAAKTPSSITFNGKTQSIPQWAEEYDLKYVTLFSRLRKGWPIEQALKTKVERRST